MAHLVMAQLGLGKTDAAWKVLDRLALEFPESKSLPPARLRVAEGALNAHQAERAAEQFRLVAGARKPGSTGASASGAKPVEATARALQVRAYRGLGKALAELGKSTEAAAAFRAALELAPDDGGAAEVALAQGRVLEDGRQTDAALKAYSDVQTRYAKSEQAAIAGLARARLLGKAGRHREASDQYERLLGDEHARECLRKGGAKPDGLLAEWGWSLVDADRSADADRVFAVAQGAPRKFVCHGCAIQPGRIGQSRANHAEVVRLLAPLAAQKTPDVKNANPQRTNPTETGEDARKHRTRCDGCFRLCFID